MAAPTKPKTTTKAAAATAGDTTTTRTGRRRPLLVELYASSIGKKWAMGVTGAFLMLYVLLHMIGNLKLYLGPEHMDEYAEWLKLFGAPAVPESGFLWIMRVALLAAVLIHIHAAYALTRMNSRARTTDYVQKRDYVAADFASRTMRWTGIIVALFIVYHLLDFTIGTTNPGFVRGDVYANVIRSFENPVVSSFYVLANLALGLHLYHGAYSLLRTFGGSNPRFEPLRRGFGVGFAALITVGNVSFPIAVLAGIVS